MKNGGDCSKMVDLVVRLPGAPDAGAALGNGTYLIGSGEECHIRLQRPDISRRHAQLIINDRSIVIMDMGSSNGTMLNDGSMLYPHQPCQLDKAVNVVKISKAELVLSARQEKRQQSLSDDFSSVSKGEIPLLEISGVPARFRPIVQEIKKQAHKELLARLNLKKMVLSGVSSQELQRQAAAMAKEILGQLTIQLPPGLSVEVIEKELVAEAIGLGPLEAMIALDDISEIMVNGPNQIFVEKKGILYKTDTFFADDNQVLSAIERIVAPLGRRIDESSPMVDARLPDGSRVNAIIPPLSLVGPSITIRKFSKKALEAKDLIDFGSVSPDMVRFLATCVAVRKNILISGGTGSGKTTLLNVLSNFLPNREPF